MTQPLQILGRISRILSRTVVIGKFDYEAFLSQPPDEVYGFYDPSPVFCPEVTLKFADNVVDNLVANASSRLVCKFNVKNGVVISVEPFKTTEEIQEDYRKKHFPPVEEKLTPTLRDKLRTVLSTLNEMESSFGSIPIRPFLDSLRTQGIEEAEAERLLKHLIQEGTVYEPKKGFLKKT